VLSELRLATLAQELDLGQQESPQGTVNSKASQSRVYWRFIDSSRDTASPQGTAYLSPAFQCWVGMVDREESRRDGICLTRKRPTDRRFICRPWRDSWYVNMLPSVETLGLDMLPALRTGTTDHPENLKVDVTGFITSYPCLFSL